MVATNYFRELFEAASRVNKTQSVQDRLSAQLQLKEMVANIDKESLTNLIQALDELPNKTRALKSDLSEYKQLEARLKQMTAERDKSNQIVLQLKDALKSEREAHTATKTQASREAAEVTRRIQALQVNILEIEQLQKQAGVLLVQSHPRAAHALARQETDRNNTRATLQKMETTAARLRQSVGLIVPPPSVPSITVAATHTHKQPKSNFGQRMALYMRIGTHAFAPGEAHAAAEQFAQMLQKQLFLGSECVEWLVTKGAPLFMHSQIAKYLRAVTHTTDTHTVLQHVHYFSTLALACVGVLQMRTYNVTAAQTAINFDTQHAAQQLALISDNLAAGRELYALCSDITANVEKRGAKDHYFVHEVKVASHMIELLKDQLNTNMLIQGDVVRLVAAADADAGQVLAHEYLPEPERLGNNNFNPAQLHQRTAPLSQDTLRPLYDCVAIVESYRWQKVPADVQRQPMRARVNNNSNIQYKKPSQEAVTKSVALAQHMLGEIAGLRPAWAQFPVGLQLLMARVMLDEFAQHGETLFLVTHRECVDFRMSEMFASARTPDEVAGMLLDKMMLEKATPSKPFNLQDYIKSVDNNNTHHPDSLFPWPPAELRRIIKSGNLAPLADFKPDYLLLAALNINQHTGCQPYLLAQNNHRQMCKLVPNSSEDVRNIVMALAMYVPVVAEPAPTENVQLTTIAAQSTDMAQAAQLLKQLIEHDRLEMPVADLNKARRVTHMLATHDPAQLVKVLQHTPGVSALTNGFDPSQTQNNTGEQIAAYLQAHPNVVLQQMPAEDIVWFRRNECQAPQCSNTATLLRNNLDTVRQALHRLGTHIKATKVNVSLVQALQYFLKLLGSPVGDSARLQMGIAAQRCQKTLAKQKTELTKLHAHLGTLRSKHAHVSKQLRESKQSAIQKHKTRVDAEAQVTASAQVIAASSDLINVIKQHLASAVSRADAVDAEAQAADTRLKAAQDLLDSATNEDRQAREADVHKYEQEVQRLRGQAADERKELLQMQQVLVEQVQVLQSKASHMASDVSLTQARSDNARTDIEALGHTQSAINQQLTTTEQEIVTQVKNQVATVADSANLANAEENARLAEQVQTLQAQITTVTKQDEAIQAKLVGLEAERDKLQAEIQEARVAQDTAQSRVHADHEREIQTLQETVRKSAEQLAQQRAEAAETATRVASQVADITEAEKLKTGLDMLQKVAMQLGEEVTRIIQVISDIGLRGTDALLQLLHDANKFTNTVINSKLASNRDVTEQTENLSKALRNFSEVLTAVMAMRVEQVDEHVQAVRAEAKQKEVEHIAALKALTEQIDELRAQQISDDTALVSEIEAQYHALDHDGQLLVTYIANLRQSPTAKAAQKHKEQLAHVLSAYQARHRSALEVIEENMRQRYLRAVEVYLMRFQPSPTVDTLAEYLRNPPMQQPNKQAAKSQESQADKSQAAKSSLIELVNTSTTPFADIVDQADKELAGANMSSEALSLVMQHTAWRRHAAYRHAAVLDMSTFVKAMIQMIESVVADQAAQQQQTISAMKKQLTTMSVDDVARLKTRLETLVRKIDKTKSLQDAWAETVALQKAANTAAAQAADTKDKVDHQLIKTVHQKRVAAAARAAAAGGIVAEAFALSTRITELQQMDMQRQTLTAELGELARKHAETNAELGRMRAALDQRDRDHTDEMNKLNDTHAHALQAHKEAAAAVKARLDAAQVELQVPAAVDAFAAARDASLVVQALRVGHMQMISSRIDIDLSDQQAAIVAAHVEYMQKADIEGAIKLHAHALSLLRDQKLESASHSMVAWLDSVRTHDMGILHRLQQRSNQPLNDTLAEILRVHKVPDLPDVEFAGLHNKQASVLVAQLQSAYESIQTQQSAMNIIRNNMITRYLAHDKVVERMTEEQAQLQKALKESEANAAKYQSQFEAAAKEQQALRAQLAADGHTNAQLTQALAKLTAEVEVLRQLQSANDALHAELSREKTLVGQLSARVAAAEQRPTVGELDSVRAQLRTLELKSNGDDDTIQQLRAKEQSLQQKLDAIEQQTATGQQLAAAKRRLHDARVHAAVSETHSLQRYDQASTEAAQHYAPDIAAIQARFREMIEKEMALAEYKDDGSPEQRAKRAERYAALAQEAVDKLVEHSQVIERKTADDMQVLADKHDREMESLRTTNEQQQHQYEEQVRALADISDSLSGTTDALDTSQIVELAHALREQFDTQTTTIHENKTKLAELAQQLSDTEAALSAARATIARVEQVNTDTNNDTTQQLRRELELTMQRLASALDESTERDKLIETHDAKIQQQNTDIARLQKQLKEQEAEFTDENNELQRHIGKLEEEKRELQKEMDQLTASNERRIREISEQLIAAQTDNTNLQTLLDAATMRNHQLQMDVESAQTCDDEVRAYFNGAFDTIAQAHNLEVLSTNDVLSANLGLGNNKTICWLLKNFILLGRDDVFNEAWPIYNKTTPDDRFNSRLLWLVIQQHLKEQGKIKYLENNQTCSEFTNPSDCIRHGLCMYDNGACQETSRVFAKG